MCISDWSSDVCSSDLADKPTPPPAPARFEIITGTPRYSPSFLATGREKVSMDPPAGKGTMNVTGLSGHFSAWAATGNHKEQTLANTSKYLCSIFVSFLCLLFECSCHRR